METSFVVLSLNVRSGLSEESWPLRGVSTVSLLLANLHSDENALLSYVSRMPKVYRKFGAEIMEIMVAEIKTNF